MDAILADIIKDFLKSPVIHTALTQAFIVGLALMLAIKLVQYVFKTSHERTKRALEILANPHCPEESRKILSDYIEVQAFETATGALVSREERDAVMAFYSRHRTKINPRQIGRALYFLEISNGRFVRGRKGSHERIGFYANVILAGLSGLILLMLLFIHVASNEISVPDTQTTILAVEFVIVFLGILWTKDSLELADKFLALEAEHFQTSNDSSQALSDS